jgi:hypothetical protein
VVAILSCSTKHGKSGEDRSSSIYPDEGVSFAEFEAGAKGEAILEALDRRYSSGVPLGASRGLSYGPIREGFRITLSLKLGNLNGTPLLGNLKRTSVSGRAIVCECRFAPLGECQRLIGDSLCRATTNHNTRKRIRPGRE